ncbi:MAG: hypothetical protein J5937_04515 [Paludibacteraceae bacterium]|nr:hypothetical protein [Paludibacteraceae bacterium]
MKKIFLIPLMALCTCVMAFAGNVGTLQELKDALAAGGNITLTANITSAEQLNITKATTIDGQGFAIKGTQQYVLQVGANATLKNLVIYAAKSKAGRGLLVDDDTNNIVLSLDNVTINATERGMDVWYSDNVTLNIKDSKIQLVPNGGGTPDATTGMPATDNYDIVTTSVSSGYSRGINLGQLTNSNVTIENSTIQGFFYNINNIAGPMDGTTVVASNSAFKGRAALNVWGVNGVYTFNDSEVIGINNFGSSQESFASFVFNYNSPACSGNKLTINGGTVVSAVFDAVGGSNPNARQFFLTARGINNSIVVNNAQYSCTKELGDNKGGLIEYMYPYGGGNYIEINDGVYDCPEIMEMNYTTTNHLVINGGSYNLSRICGTTLDSNPLIKFQTTHLTGGTYTTNMSEIYEYNTNPGEEDNQVIPLSIIADGYKQVTNANGTYSIVPVTTETQSTAVNDVNWNTAVDWSTTSQAATVVPDEQTSVTIGNGVDEVSVVVKNDGAAEVYRVDMTDNVTLTVKDGGVLTVGDGGIVAHENAAVVVEEGGSLILNGLVQGTENFVIETSEAKTAAVLIDPAVNTYGDEHPVGTFRFKSKSYVDGNKVVHQRFGMPTYNTGVSVQYGTASSALTYITNWDYENDDWAKEGSAVKWTAISATGTTPLVSAGPFTCYDMISNNAKGAEITYEFKGDLMGNSDAEMSFNHGFNPYANSYTAPIDIASLLARIENTYGESGIDATIYLYKSLANDNYTWVTLNQSDYTFGAEEGTPTTIAPMQAFMLRLGGTTPQTASIDYQDNVYDPFLAKLAANAAGAPARRTAAKQNFISLSIADVEGIEYDRVKFIEDDRFSSAFDNGYDAVKFMKENVAIYAVADEAMATVASDYVEGMNIGVKAAKSGVYTLNIKHNGLDYALIDTENNNVIELVAGTTYNFYQEAGQNDARFQIVKVNKVPTAIDQLEDDAMSTKFIKNGVLYILKNGAIYNAQGQVVK